MSSQSLKNADDQGHTALSRVDQGQTADIPNHRSSQFTRDDGHNATENSQASAPNTLVRADGEENPTTDERPTGEDEDEKDDGGSGRDRRQGVSPPKETCIEKNKKVEVVNGCQQWTAYAVRTATHVYKLSRDSELVPTLEALTDRKERVEFVKRHGVATRR